MEILDVRVAHGPRLSVGERVFEEVLHRSSHDAEESGSWELVSLSCDEAVVGVFLEESHEKTSFSSVRGAGCRSRLLPRLVVTSESTGLAYPVEYGAGRGEVLE